MIKLVFIFLSFIFFTSCSTDYLKDNNLSAERKNELDSSITENDRRYILKKIFVEDKLQLNSYFTKDYLLKFSNTHYKINEIYSNTEINNFFKKTFKNYDEYMSKYLIYKLQDYKFYIYLYDKFSYFFITLFIIIVLLILINIYVLFARIHLQNNMVYSAKMKNENDSKYLNSQQLKLKHKSNSLEQKEVYINQKINMLEKYPNLLKDYDYLVDEIKQKSNDLNHLNKNFDDLYHHKIIEIEDDFNKVYLEKTTQFEESCLKKYDIEKELSNGHIELKKMLKSLSKNMQHVIDNPTNNDQIHKLFIKVNRLINHYNNIISDEDQI